MGRRRSFLLLALVLVPATHVLGGIGIFEETRDIRPAGSVGKTESVGLVDKNGTLVEQYEITSYGSDIWGTRDQFHFAYRTMSGNWRVSADFQWAATPPNPSSKMGVMIRASTAEDSVQYDTVVTDFVGGMNIRTGMQWRAATGGDSSEEYVPGKAAGRLGIQRVLIGGEIPAIESIADFGNGWERVGSLKILPDLSDTSLLGVCVASHDASKAATALVTDVVYERAEMVGPAPTIAVIPASSAKEAAATNRKGFVVRTVKAPFAEGWGRAEMDKLLDFGGTGPANLGPDVAAGGIEEGSREVRFVNLYDSGGRGVFSIANGYGDETFPGIDSLETPTENPAAGDDDDHFATEVLAVIHLTPGLHVIGVNDDEGTVVEIGGVEIGRSAEWKTASTTDFIFEVRKEGFYTLRARHFEGSGGAALEMHEVVKTADGSWKRILLGDVYHGGSAVYVPEPATIVLLGLGTLALLCRKR